MSLGRGRRWGGVKLESMERLLHESVVVHIHRSEVLAAYAEIDVAMREAGRTLGKNDLRSPRSLARPPCR